jgi:hypothetical protein
MTHASFTTTLASGMTAHADHQAKSVRADEPLLERRRLSGREARKIVRKALDPNGFFVELSRRGRI